MKIAARLIYYKAVTPTMDIFELPDEIWREFLYAKNARRIEIVCGLRNTIKPYVDEFIAFAKSHPDLFFWVTRIGCGIAGFSDSDIAPLFKDALNLPNVALPESFVEIL